MKLQKAVKDETVFVALGSVILSAVMVIVFFVLHRAFPVQKVAGIENYDQAYRSMQVSYRYRTFLQLIWCVLTMVLKFINPVAGMLPLLWPSLLIKGRGILNGVKN